MKIAHLSDPHFGTVKPEVRKALYDQLIMLKPDLIIMSGDITQRARRSQFRAASEFLKSVAHIPIVAIPGNHDIPLFNIFVRLFNPYAAFRHLFKGTLGREVQINNVQVLALNSTSRFRHVQGALPLNKLKEKLARTKSDAVIKIVTFHHPLSCPKRVDVKNLLKNRKAVMEIFNEHQVDLVLGGHIHDPHVCLSTEHFPEIDRPLIVGVAGTCLSWRIRKDAPNSFNLIEVDQISPAISIERFDFQKDFIFRSVGIDRFSRDSRGWNKVDHV